MDDELRVSRSKVGPVEQLRVFVRASTDVEETPTIEAIEEETEVEEAEISEAPSDVEEEPSEEEDEGEEGDEDIEAPSDVESED